MLYSEAGGKELRDSGGGGTWILIPAWPPCVVLGRAAVQEVLHPAGSAVKTTEVVRAVGLSVSRVQGQGDGETTAWSDREMEAIASSWTLTVCHMWCSDRFDSHCNLNCCYGFFCFVLGFSLFCFFPF